MKQPNGIGMRFFPPLENDQPLLLVITKETTLLSGVNFVITKGPRVVVFNSFSIFPGFIPNVKRYYCEICVDAFAGSGI